MNETLHKANGKLVRVNGRMFKIIAHKWAGRVLAQAESFVGNERVDLVHGRSPLVRAIRQQIGCGLTH